MGGKEGGRGYLYQGIVAVLEALRRNDWDRIYIEFPTAVSYTHLDVYKRQVPSIHIQILQTVTKLSFRKCSIRLQ